MNIRLGWSVVVLAVGTACGSTSGSGGTEDEGERLDGLAARYCGSLKAACERQVECGVVLLNQGTTVDDCYDRTACTQSMPDLLDAGVAIDEQALGRCEAVTRSVSCDELLNEGWYEAVPECHALLTGKAEAGEACQGGLTSGCKPGLECDLSEQCPGTCVPAAAPGEVECLGLDCPEGQYCSFGECFPEAAPGESCEWLSFDEPWDRTCGDRYTCSAELEDPRCEPASELGAACEGGNADVCVSGAVCREGICQVPRALGESCEALEECAIGLTCDIYNHVCRTPKSEGESCRNYYYECAGGLSCQDGSCQPKSAESLGSTSRGPLLQPGDACGSSGVCPLGTSCLCDGPDCAELLCKPGPDLGESCEASAVTRVIEDVGSITVVAEDGFDPYRCRRGYCDLFGSVRCVEPQPEGEPCSFDEPRFTFECLSMMCAERRCQGYEALSCSASDPTVGE